MNKKYKILHIPTGLYLSPARSNVPYSTLSEKGKIYSGPAAWNRLMKGSLYDKISIDCHDKIFSKYSRKFKNHIATKYNINTDISLSGPLTGNIIEDLKKLVLHPEKDEYYGDIIEFPNNPCDFIQEWQK